MKNTLTIYAKTSNGYFKIATHTKEDALLLVIDEQYRQIVKNTGFTEDITLHLLWYQNIENGNILTYQEMIQEGAELYDLNDDTNIYTYEDYYKKIYI